MNYPCITIVRKSQHDAPVVEFCESDLPAYWDPEDVDLATATDEEMIEAMTLHNHEVVVLTDMEHADMWLKDNPYHLAFCEVYELAKMELA